MLDLERPKKPSMAGPSAAGPRKAGPGRQSAKVARQSVQSAARKGSSRK